MRALELTDGFGLEHLKVVERPDPVPGHGEVLVRMKAVSLNFRDLLMVQGAYSRAAAALPIIPFSDGCGVVEGVGPGVTRVKVGDRVSTLFFQNWNGGRATMESQMSSLGQPIPGAGRELAVFSEQGVSKVPDFLTDHQVATLPCAGLTAWRSMFRDADLQAGDTVVLQGTGGVSVFGLQFAKAAGFRTVITSSSDEKLERTKALGANHTHNYRSDAEWSKTVRAATAGRGADFVMEVGGAKTLQESLKSVRIGGHISIIGILSGPAEPLQFGWLIATSARLQGVSVGSREMFEDMCRAIELHKIEPVVDKVFPMAETVKAFEAMQAGEHFGKIVVDLTA
jgi:NADPH:quinone reductase-like Zn-dependent oxidoreductase